MKLLDLFCGAGGAGMGYHRAGFEVVGVDNRPMPRYPFEFHQADALEYLAAHGHEFDVIHASPPCQGYSSHVSSRSRKWTPTRGKDEPKLIADARRLLMATGKPFVIENVYGSRNELSASLMLCGGMFGLLTPRHRLFELSMLIFSPPHTCVSATRQAEILGWNPRDLTVTGKGRNKGTTEKWMRAIGIDWQMTQSELSEAIPPAYTEYIGKQLLAQVQR